MITSLTLSARGKLGTSRAGALSVLPNSNVLCSKSKVMSSPCTASDVLSFPLLLILSFTLGRATYLAFGAKTP